MKNFQLQQLNDSVWQVFSGVNGIISKQSGLGTEWYAVRISFFIGRCQYKISTNGKTLHSLEAAKQWIENKIKEESV